MKIMFLANGCTAIFDNKGNQIPELSKPWILFYVDYLLSQEIDPEQVQIELPYNKARFFKTPNGYNWELI